MNSRELIQIRLHISFKIWWARSFPKIIQTAQTPYIYYYIWNCVTQDMDSRRVIAVAFIGKQNEPLYFYCEEDYAELIHVQMIAHSSLDIIEEKRKKWEIDYLYCI